MGQVTMEVVDGVATITFDNPEVKNALSFDMARQALDLCDEVDRRDDIGAVIVTGAGTTFCSGADTRVLLAADTPADVGAISYNLFVRVGTLRPPTVAAVRGAAVGAGMNLAMATDLRIVATDARLIAGFQRIGIHPGGGFFSLAGRLGGREVASALGVFGAEISGERAVALGMAWEAVPGDAVLDRAMELAHRAARDPELSRRIVASMRLELGPPAIPWQAAVELEAGAQAWSRARLHERPA